MIWWTTLEDYKTINFSKVFLSPHFFKNIYLRGCHAEASGHVFCDEDIFTNVKNLELNPWPNNFITYYIVRNKYAGVPLLQEDITTLAGNHEYFHGFLTNFEMSLVQIKDLILNETQARRYFSKKQVCRTIDETFDPEW